MALKIVFMACLMALSLSAIVLAVPVAEPKADAEADALPVADADPEAEADAYYGYSNYYSGSGSPTSYYGYRPSSRYYGRRHYPSAYHGYYRQPVNRLPLYRQRYYQHVQQRQQPHHVAAVPRYHEHHQQRQPEHVAAVHRQYNEPQQQPDPIADHHRYQQPAHIHHDELKGRRVVEAIPAPSTFIHAAVPAVPKHHLKPHPASHLLENAHEKHHVAVEEHHHEPAIAPAVYENVIPIQNAVVSTQHHSQDELGNVEYGYANPNSVKEERRDAYGNVVGAYSYVDGTGLPKHVAYVADKAGFRVTNSNALPGSLIDNQLY